MATSPNAVTPATLSQTYTSVAAPLGRCIEIAHLVSDDGGGRAAADRPNDWCTSLILSGGKRHKFGWSFFVTQTWDPVSGDFGALPFIYGTLVTSAVALFIAVPLGVGAAIFLAELAPPKLSSSLTFVSDLLAAVPSA